MIYIPVSRTFYIRCDPPTPLPEGNNQYNGWMITPLVSSRPPIVCHTIYFLIHPRRLVIGSFREVKIAGVLSPRHNYQQRFRINFKVFWTADKIIREFILSVMLGKETPKREKKDILISEWNSNSRPHHRMRSLLFHQPTELKTSIMHRHI